MLKTYIVFALLAVYSSVSFAASEVAVVHIPLAAPLNQADAEISGLTWCGDRLIVLPQYPRRLSKNKASDFYWIPKSAVLKYLDKPSNMAIQAETIEVNENGLRKRLTIFDGYEAIDCDGDSVWLTIEALNLLGVYHSYLVRGTVDWYGEQPSIQLHPKSLLKLESQSEMRNMGDEAIFTSQKQIISVHEVNDPRIVDAPTARVLDKHTGMRSELPFPHLPYRITDTTKLDTQNRFWAINYKYSGDKFSRKATDPIAEQYGIGPSHEQYYNVERLLEFELKKDRIVLSNRPPIQLKMVDVEGRNWEGLVRLDKLGFLLATDKHPETILGFVPLPTKH